MDNFSFYSWWGGLSRGFRFGVALAIGVVSLALMLLIGPKLGPIIFLGISVILLIATFEIND